MDSFEDIMKKDNEEHEDKYNKAMTLVKKQVSNRIFKKIEWEIKESEGGYIFDIVNTHRGEKETDVEDDLEVWVNQTTNGGYTGDEFAGEVYVKLPDGKYLTWNYSM